MSNYDILKSTVEALASRETTDEQMAAWILLVETQLNRRLRIQEMIVREKLRDGLKAGVFLYSLPTEALTLVNVEVEANNRRYSLDLHSMEALDELFGGRGADAPEGYCIVGRDIEIRPCPNQSYPCRLAYHSKVPAVTKASSTSWLLDINPDLYTYGVLQHLSIFVRDTAGTQLWAELFGNAMSEIQITSDEAEWSGATPAAVAL